jgi:hypothetical protein
MYKSSKNLQKIRHFNSQRKHEHNPLYKQFYNAQLWSACVWTHYQDIAVPRLRYTRSNPSSIVTRQSQSTQGVDNWPHESEKGLCNNIPKFDFFVFLLCAAIFEMKWCDMLHRRWAYVHKRNPNFSLFKVTCTKISNILKFFKWGIAPLWLTHSVIHTITIKPPRYNCLFINQYYFIFTQLFSGQTWTTRCIFFKQMFECI